MMKTEDKAFVELTPGATILHSAFAGNCSYFRFSVSGKNNLITISVTPKDNKWNPELYVSVNDPDVSPENYLWKSSIFANVPIQIGPIDSKYYEGTYYLCVYPICTECSTSFYICVAISEPSLIQSLNEEKITSTILPNDYQYYSYRITLPAEGKFLHVFAEPGPDKLYLCASPDSMYPNEKNCISDTELSIANLLGDYCTTLDPFVLNCKNEIEYRTDLTSSTAKYSNTCKDSVALKIEGDHWKYCGDTCYIAVKNIYKASFTYTISAKEISEVELLDKENLEKYNTFLKMFDSIDGSKLSHKERNEKNLEKSQFTYGEIEFLYFLPFLRVVSEGRKELKFWDIGCGAGKCLIAAALAENFSEAYGVEYLEKLANVATKVCEKFEKSEVSNCKLRVVNGDMTTTDWSNADLVFTSSICFPEELITAITEQAKLLKKGARVATMKMIYDEENFKLVYDFKVKMTWGLVELYVLERT